MWSIPSYGLPQTLPHGSWTYSKHTPRLTSVPSAFASLVASVRNPTSKGPVQSKKVTQDGSTIQSGLEKNKCLELQIGRIDAKYEE